MDVEKKYFRQLLSEAGLRFHAKFPELSVDINEWKGEEISRFREELYNVVGDSISEKWFYTHVKGDQEKIPRIDTINIIANYVGYKGWKHYLYEVSAQNSPTKKKVLRYRSKLWLPFLVLLVIFALIISSLSSEKNYTFCFIDRATGQALKDSSLKINLIRENESPANFLLKGNCFEGSGNFVEFTVRSHYYKPLNVRRSIDKDAYKEEIALASDDYAMIIHLFSSSNVKDWKRRRQQLKEMMHEDIRVYQVDDAGFSIALYNRKEFIDKLTLPTRSLKKMEILDTFYKEDKIIHMRFKQ